MEVLGLLGSNKTQTHFPEPNYTGKQRQNSQPLPKLKPTFITTHTVIIAHSWRNQLLSTVHSRILPYTIILQPINRLSSLEIHTPKPEEEWQEASSSSHCRLHTKPKPSSIMLLFFHNTTPSPEHHTENHPKPSQLPETPYASHLQHLIPIQAAKALSLTKLMETCSHTISLSSQASY